MSLKTFLCACLVLIVFEGAAAADPKPERIDGSPLWPVHYYTPQAGRKLEGVVIAISDRGGWDDAAAALAKHLTENVTWRFWRAMSRRTCPSTNTVRP